jgi:uncharacterized protein YggE
MNQRAVLICSIVLVGAPVMVQASNIPMADETPEEVLQTEVITSGRSPIDNQPLTATQYAELQTQIDRANQVPPQLSSKVRNTVALLKLRKFIKTVLPFIPIK